MKKRIVFHYMFLVLIIASCTHSVPHQAFINGTLTEAAGMKFVLQEMGTRDIRSLDSVVPDQTGTFVFKVDVKEKGFWLIRATTGKILVLFLNAGDHVELSGSAADFPDRLVMNGPAETMLLHAFYERTRKREKLVDSLEMLLVERQDSSDYYQLTQKLDTAFRTIWEAQREEEIKFINLHPGSIASLLVLNYAFGMSPVLGPEEDFGYYEKLDSALNVQFSENKHVKFHHQRVMEIRRARSNK